MRAMILATISLGCLLVLVAATLAGRALAASPATIELAVAQALRQHGATYSSLSVENAACIPSRDTCLSYIADVVVTGERPARGRLWCRAPERGCTLRIDELGLRYVAVPDPRPPTWWPWYRAARSALDDALQRIAR